MQSYVGHKVLSVLENQADSTVTLLGVRIHTREAWSVPGPSGSHEQLHGTTMKLLRFLPVMFVSLCGFISDLGMIQVQGKASCYCEESALLIHKLAMCSINGDFCLFSEEQSMK